MWTEYEEAASPEARFVKGLDKLETILQHNQGLNSPDFDYRFNLEYGRKYMDSHPLLRRIRALADASTPAAGRGNAGSLIGGPGIEILGPERLERHGVDRRPGIGYFRLDGEKRKAPPHPMRDAAGRSLRFREFVAMRLPYFA